MVATMQQHIDAPSKTVTWLVRINGVVTECIDVTVRHAVTSPIGSCTISLPLPLPSHITLGATVEVQAGYLDQVHTIFTGTIPSRTRSISTSGFTATLTAVSANHRIADKDYADVEYAGPISLRDLFQAMAKRRGVTSYYSDDTTYPDGVTLLRFGNNQYANDAKVVVPRKTSSLHFLNDIANLFGYYVYDTPLGLRQKLVSGMPYGDSAVTVTEAWNALSLDRTEDAASVVDYWEVFGASYTDPDGVDQQIRSIPSSVPANYTRDEISSDIIDTLALANAVRNVHEVNHGEPYEEVRWTTHGAPHLIPGDVASVTSPLLDASGLQWLMSVEHTLDASGFVTTCTGWRGAGTSIPAGQDCVTTAIPGGPWHIGDEYVGWYARPNPQGTDFRVPFTVVANYSSIAMYGLAHGTNSQLIGGGNTDLEVSRFEIWQNGEKVSEGTLPVLNEDYALRLPYGGSDRYWSRIVVPMSGSLEPGAAELRFIAGDTDDYEVKNLSMRTCGIGEPAVGVAR